MNGQAPEPIYWLNTIQCLELIQRIVERWDGPRLNALAGDDRARFKGHLQRAVAAVMEANDALDPGGVLRLLSNLETLSEEDRERLERLQREAGRGEQGGTT